MLELLQPLQIVFKPALFILLIWSSYRTILKGDRAVGLVLYLALVIIVDSFLNTGIFIPGMSYGSIRYSEVCAFFLILSNPPNRHSKENGNFLTMLLVLYFFLFIISALRGVTVEDGLNNFRRYIIPQITAFWVSYRGFDRKEDYGRFFFHFGALILLIALFIFWDLFFDRWILYSESLRTNVYQSDRSEGRYGSFFLNPNYMGAFAVLIFPAVFINGIVEKNILKKIYCWIGILALLFCLVETQSRGPFLGFMVSLCLFLFIPVKGFSFFKKIAVLCIFLIAFFLFMPGFFEHSTERFTTIDEEMDSGKRSRLSVWSYALRIISDNPFLGIGLGEQQFLKRMFQYGFVTEFQQRPLDNPHNSFLQIAAYAGVPALIIFVVFNMALLKRGISIIMNNTKRDISYYLMGVISGLLGFLACSFTGGFIFYNSVSPAYWLFLGLLFAMITPERPVEST